MKLDMNRAWTDALSLIQANLGVVAIVAGVFFFLPYLAFMLLMPDAMASMQFAERGFIAEYADTDSHLKNARSSAITENS